MLALAFALATAPLPPSTFKPVLPPHIAMPAPSAAPSVSKPSTPTSRPPIMLATPQATPAAREAGAAPGAPFPRIPLRWEELPPALQARLEPLIGSAPAQAVLQVQDSAKLDTEWREVDYGAELMLQSVEPGPGAELAADPPRAQYGKAGDLLWAARIGKDDAYCGHGGHGHIYCWVDRDKDGRFEVLYENDPIRTRDISTSRWEFATAGHLETLAQPVAYRKSDKRPELGRDAVTLRYIGPVAGRVRDDGAIVEGLVLIEVRTGAEGLSMRRTRLLGVSLDADGAGLLNDDAGYVIQVSRVEVDGRARLKVLGGLPKGPTLLKPAVSREALVRFVANVLLSASQVAPLAAAPPPELPREVEPPTPLAPAL